MPKRTPLVAANWKMNGSQAANAAWLRAFAGRRSDFRCDVVICAPSVYLAALATASGLEIGGQDVSEHAPGAYTGDIAAAMLIDVGCRWVIVGHSERRQLHGESDEVVAAKAEAALTAGLRPIVCVGETLAERDAGATLAVVQRQLDAIAKRVGPDGLVRGCLAYEPVWAIGTGRTATPEQAQDVHSALRARIGEIDRATAEAVRILYGGSVKPTNAAELFGCSDIDGGLIGGASLVAEDFAAICAAAG
jgi:triosephosphate isomerase